MKRHPYWLAVGLLLFVVLACNMSRNRNTDTSNTNANSDETEQISADTRIREAYMAKDDGNGKPGSRTKNFAPADRVLHAVAVLKEAKEGTAMKFSWWVVDAEGTKNKTIKDIDYTTKAGENTVHGHLSLPRDWPVGKYKVQIYVDGDLDRTIAFNVE